MQYHPLLHEFLTLRQKLLHAFVNLQETTTFSVTPDVPIHRTLHRSNLLPQHLSSIAKVLVACRHSDIQTPPERLIGVVLGQVQLIEARMRAR